MKTIEVVAAVIKEDDKFFITRRGYGEFIDMWEFPGGKIEPGEKREEALHREIKEELELDIENLEFLTTVDYDYPKFHLTMHCYLCNISGGILHLNAHNGVKWVTLDEIDNEKWIPADVAVVNSIKEKFLK